MIEQFAVSSAVIIGLVNGIQIGFPQTKGFISFGISLGLGVGFGAFGYFGLRGIEDGIIVALMSSGLYKLAQKAGGE
jgi:hypothetical protein